MQAFGIDIGGTGIKGAPVDLATGKLLEERKKIATPQPATPEAVTEVVKELAQSFGWTGPIGATFPGVVIDGTIRTAANVDKILDRHERGEPVPPGDRDRRGDAERRRRGGHRRDDVRRGGRGQRAPCSC